MIEISKLLVSSTTCMMETLSPIILKQSKKDDFDNKYMACVIYCFGTFMYAYQKYYIANYSESNWETIRHKLFSECMSCLNELYYGVSTQDEYNDITINIINNINKCFDIYTNSDSLWHKNNDSSNSVFPILIENLADIWYEDLQRDSQVIDSLTTKLFYIWEELAILTNNK